VTKKSLVAMPFVALFLASLLMMASCAKKQVKVEEEAKPTATVTPAPKALEPQEATPTVNEDAARKAEEERLARLREQEEAQKLKAEIEAFESTHIYFDFDKSDLRPEARAVLEKKAAWLKVNSQFKVTIGGHCDERGTSEYNLALGEKRAKAAAKYLSALGVSTEKMTSISYGEERPAEQGHDEEAWAKNRRDEFKLGK
jgi:peptidoglycan-associated lipoprotein